MSRTILVVDDTASLREVVRITLSQAGYDVIEAEDGQIALDLLKTMEGRKVHLIVSDLNMPNMDGLTFVRELKKLPAYRFTPIIMLTTEHGLRKQEEGREAGIQAWVVKPFLPPRLLEAVYKLLL